MKYKKAFMREGGVYLCIASQKDTLSTHNNRGERDGEGFHVFCGTLPTQLRFFLL